MNQLLLGLLTSYTQALVDILWLTTMTNHYILYHRPFFFTTGFSLSIRQSIGIHSLFQGDFCSNLTLDGEIRQSQSGQLQALKSINLM